MEIGKGNRSWPFLYIPRKILIRDFGQSFYKKQHETLNILCIKSYITETFLKIQMLWSTLYVRFDALWPQIFDDKCPILYPTIEHHGY